VDIKGTISENKKRREVINALYDPIIGIGSPIPRFKFTLRENEYILLPESMKDVPAIKEALKYNCAYDFVKNVSGDKGNNNVSKNFKEYVGGISECRLDHDFEFYAYTTNKIKDKESGQDVPFKLNRPQRKLLKAFETQRLKNLPIRAKIGKARQWGGSTLTQLYMKWIQTRHKTGWNSCIVADVEDQARTIRAMYSNVARHYPEDISSVTLSAFEGSTKNKKYIERDCIISIGSMQRPESLRSTDLKLAHFSECASWKTTEGKKPEDLIQSIRGTVPYLPLTMVVEESTAKGVGNYWHRSYTASMNGEDGYIAVFVAWWEIERYQLEIKNVGKFIRSMSEYEWYLWELGATLEGINWFRTILRDEFSGDMWRMMSEFPSTEKEMFQSTGRRAFAPSYVLQARKYNCKPTFKGELFGESNRGKKTLVNIKFEKTNNGNLWVWALPDKSVNMKNRYAAFADVGGRTKDADWSVVTVIDRYDMVDGGVPMVVARWRGHLDQDLFAWKAAQLASFYNNALLAVESNSLKTEKDEGDHSLTVLDQIADYYKNLYMRTAPDKIKDIPAKYGFHTNKQTKPMIIDTLNAALRDNLYIELDARACDEMDWFELKEDGTYGAVDGQHDDIVITTAGAVWLAYSYMDKPVEYEKHERRKSKIINEASF